MKELIATLREAYQYAEEHPDETALFALISPHRLKEAADALERQQKALKGLVSSIDDIDTEYAEEMKWQGLMDCTFVADARAMTERRKS